MDQAIYSPDHQWFHSLLSHPIFNPSQSSVSPQKPRTTNRAKSKQSLHLSDISAIEQPSTLNSINNTIVYEDDTSLSSSFVSSSFTSSAQDSGNLKSESYVNGSNEMNEVLEFLQAVSYNLMCVRDTQLFVCVGREIRVLDLREIKKDWMLENAAGETENEDVERSKDRNSVKFWPLRIPNLTFQPREIILSLDGRLMAVVGEIDVLIVVLPRSVKSSVDCRSYILGGQGMPVGHGMIAKVLWHPLSPYNSHIMVLTSDAVLRLYDIQESTTTPEQTFYLLHEYSWTTHSSHMFAADKESTEAVSFTFGYGPFEEDLDLEAPPTSDIWGLFTLYGLMKNGDVYALCPVVPLKCLLTYEQYDIFRSHHESLLSTSSSTPLPTSDKNQLQFLSLLLDTVEPFPPSHSNPNQLPPYMLCHSAVWKEFTPISQGPFLYKPLPPELDADIFSNAVQISCLNLKPVNSVVVAWDNGRIDICLEVEKVLPRWGYKVSSHNGKSLKISGSSGSLPTFIVYESIDLGLSSNLSNTPSHSSSSIPAHSNPTTVEIVVDPLYSDTFYVFHSMGAHCVNLSNWTSGLIQSWRQFADGQQSLENALESGDSSDVSWIVSTIVACERAPNPVIGLAIITDSYLGYSLLLLTSSFDIVPLELCLRSASISDSSNSAPPSQAQTTITAENDNQLYSSLLVHPFTIHETLERRRNTRQPVLVSSGATAFRIGGKGKRLGDKGAAGDNELISLSELTTLGTGVERLRADLMGLIDAGENIIDRINLQTNELHHQQSVISDLSDSIAEKLETLSMTQRKLASIQQTQTEISLRADTILQILMDRFEPRLSVWEKAFGDYLRNQKNMVRKLKGETVKIQRSLPRILREYQAYMKYNRSQSASSVNGMLSKDQDFKIRTVLSHQSEMIQDLQEKLTNLKLRMDRG